MLTEVNKDQFSYSSVRFEARKKPNEDLGSRNEKKEAEQNRTAGLRRGRTRVATKRRSSEGDDWAKWLEGCRPLRHWA